MRETEEVVFNDLSIQESAAKNLTVKIETNAYVIALVEVALIISTQLMQLPVRFLKHSLKEELFDNVGYVYETYT